MIEKVNKDIENINNNIEILPKNNKKNLHKYALYLDECIDRYKFIMEEILKEVDNRFKSIESKYKDLKYEIKQDDIKYNSIKLSDKRVRSSEKLNLEFLFYNLDNSTGSLDEINRVISLIIANFKGAGIPLKEEDFNITENVNLYIHTLLKERNDIQDVFNDIFFKSPDILKQIELNVKYIYYQNEKKIEEYFNNKYVGFDFDTFISNHKNTIMGNEKTKHESLKYLYDIFINKEYDYNEFMNDNKIDDLKSSFLIEENNERNYDNLLKLEASLKEYKLFKKFDFIIKDMKELYAKKEEYKDVFSTKLKDISTKEKEMYGLNKKIAKTGFFRLKGNKLTEAKQRKTELMNELIADYNELDTLKIKDTIYKYVDVDTNYYDLLKFATYNFNYFASLIKAQNEDADIETIKDSMLELQKFIYDNYIDIINNVTILEERELDKIICEKYKLNSISITPEKMDIDQIDVLISDIHKLLLYYDINRLGLNLKDIKFLLDVPEIVK